MMTLRAALAVTAVCWGAAAAAQALQPAEAPPAGFQGDVYVDSRGCVFLRAGFGNATTYVPQLDVERRPICGSIAAAPPPARPSAPGADAPETAEAPEPRPEDLALTDVEPATFFSGRAAGPPPARSAVEEPARRVVAATPRVVAATPRAPFRAPVVEATPVKMEYAPQGHGHAPLYIPGPTVGGQVTHVGPSHSGGVVADGGGYVVLGHVRKAVPDVPVPHGYRRAWEDGRLNPYRGPRSFEGAAQSGRVWTFDVPRELKERPIHTVLVPADRAPKYARGRTVYVGGVRDAAAAHRIQDRLRGFGIGTAFHPGPDGLIIVVAGPYGAEQAAAGALRRVHAAGYHGARLH